MSYRPDIPPQIKKSKFCPAVPAARNNEAFNSPTRRCPKGPRCNRSSGAVLESHHAFCFLGEAAVSVEAASVSFWHPADSKKCRQSLQHVPAMAAGQPQDRLENLKSEEPASPKPSIPDLELVLHPFDCRVCSAGRVGLAWPKYGGGLPAHSHWRQSRDHCCPGSISPRAAAAEDGGALGPLCEGCHYPRTSAVETWETARAQTGGVEFMGSLLSAKKAPKHFVATT